MKKNTKSKNKSVRLVSHITPIHYAITLKPDLESHIFSGHETITISLDKPTKNITLHSKDLSIKTANVIFGKNNIDVKNISYDVSTETVSFDFPSMLPKGKVKLSIVFEGVLADDMRGFYKSKYVVDGKEHTMATTQFEATDARRAFPCFDEPSHKAVFDVNLVIAENKMAISNTLPTAVIDHEAGYKIVSFASTPKMSTYLLAFIVGDFEWVEAKSKGDVLVRVLTVPGKSHQAKFALDVTVKCLEFYEEYFDISYPLNTLDMIAIPDFASGAMENWGAITFREACLLVDDNHTSTTTKDFVAEVIAHELAHQWFGNLVTMEWWTHLWLNEGFASYIPYLAIDKLFPEWNIWEKFSTQTLASALRLDALENTHSIEIDVHNPSEIGEIFDAVSYNKGASVIRMLAEYIGEKHFRDGLRYYLKKHSYKNASTIHLWEAFEKVSKLPVKKMMAVWTRKPGYPVVSAELSGKNIKFSQKRYFSSAKHSKKNSDKTLWPIPLSIVTNVGEKHLPLMTKKQSTIPSLNTSWFKCNAHEGGVYRVHYDKKIIESLKEPIRTGVLGAQDRLGIVRDAFSFAESGEMSTTEALEIALLYKEEKEYIVWVEIISGLTFVSNLLSGTKEHKHFATYAREILSSIVKDIDWEQKENESHNATLMRSLILGTASYFEENDVINKAHGIFINRNEKIIHADLRRLVYATVARNGDEKEYEELVSMYRKETLIEEKNRILRSLGQFKNKRLLARALEFTMSEEVRTQDRNGAFASVVSNVYGRTLAWNFIKKNWKKIVDGYGAGNHMISHLIGILNCNTTIESYKDIQSFYKMNPTASAERTIQQTLEHIDSNIRWLKRDGVKISQWLKNYNK